MGWMSKLINKHNGKERCLICDAGVPDDAAVVEYRYKGGTGKAFICKKCEEHINKDAIDPEDAYEAL